MILWEKNFGTLPKTIELGFMKEKILVDYKKL